MPFLNQITDYINDTLRAGSLNKKILQPVEFCGLSTIVGRKKDKTSQLELLPAIVADKGVVKLITPESKYGMQLYHKVITNTYEKDQKSVGDSYNIRSISEMSLIVISNGKLTGKAKEALEPVVLFGMPQNLSSALIADLKIKSCLITLTASNLNQVEVFRQEYPQSEYFLSEQMSMFSIRYRITMSFSQACVEQCLCN